MTKITSRLIETYIKCQTKCWLTNAGEQAANDSYESWLNERDEEYRTNEVNRLNAGVPSDQKIANLLGANPAAATWTVASDIPVRAENLESQLATIERTPSPGRGKPAQFIPIRFFRANKIGRDEKLLLTFDAYLLSKMLDRRVPLGKIIHGDARAVVRVKTAGFTRDLSTLLPKITLLVSSNSPPELVLNRHCAECGFQSRCRQAAIEKDELSLLARMTDKERNKFHSKGFFTVTQLSHTFRPRRRAKRQRDKQEKYHHALKALAIREKKIHVVGRPTFEILGTPVYIDVEGLPDLDFYYLIGVRVVTNGADRQYSFWADGIEGERSIWNELLQILGSIANPVLIHYGGYETVFLRRMCERYGSPPPGSAIAAAIGSAVNLVSAIFAQVYFPTFSNSLKDIAGWLGFQWSDAGASGLQSIRWRHEWQSSRASSAKQSLITYNAEDCRAAEILANKLTELRQTLPIAKDSLTAGVVDTTLMKRKAPSASNETFSSFRN